MSTKSLLDKIESLPPDKKAEVEQFVDTLSAHVHEDNAGTPGLVERLRAHREQLLNTHGHFDSLPLIRDLRDNQD